MPTPSAAAVLDAQRKDGRVERAGRRGCHLPAAGRDPSPTTRSSCSTPRARALVERGRRAAQGLPRRGDHRPPFLRVLHRRTSRATGPPTSCCARARTAASRTRAGACARTARASGPTWSSRRCATRTATLRRLRQGHARPHRAPRSTRSAARRARSASACWSRACRTTRSSCSTPRAASRAGTPAPSASRATAPTRSSASTSRVFYPPEDIAAGAPARRAARRAAAPPRRGHGLARCARTARASGPTSWSPRCTTRRARTCGFAKVTRDLTRAQAHGGARGARAATSTEFLAMLAHELRNPLAPIRNAVEHPRGAPRSLAAGRLVPRRDRPPGRRTSRGWSTTCST